MKSVLIREKSRNAIATLIKMLLITVLYIAVSGRITYAAGMAQVSGDKETASVGDTFTVTIEVKNEETDAVAPEISVNYDANRLAFNSCSGEYGGGPGGFIQLNASGKYTVEFTILSGGQANVEVRVVYNGDGSTEQVYGAGVFVDGEDIAASATEGMPEGEGMEPVNTGVDAGIIPMADGRAVSTVIPDDVMPTGFYKTTTNYEGQTIEGAQFENGDMLLIYETDSEGNNGALKIYNQATGALDVFLQIPGGKDGFIIALSAGEDVIVPDGFESAVLNWNDKTLEAYTYVGNAKESDISANDFFLIYAMGSQGTPGWYMYDQVEGTYQRFAEPFFTASGKGAGADDGILSQIIAVGDNGEEGGINFVLIALIVIAVIFVALLVTVIIMGVKLKEFNSYEYIDEYEDEEEPAFNGSNLNNNVQEMPMGAGSLAILSAENGAPSVPEYSTDFNSNIKPEPQAKPAMDDEMTEVAPKRPVAPKTKTDSVVDDSELEEIKIEQLDDISDEMPDEMPKSKNIYEQFRAEDEAVKEVKISKEDEVEKAEIEEAAVEEDVEEEAALETAEEDDVKIVEINDEEDEASYKDDNDDVEVVTDKAVKAEEPEEEPEKPVVREKDDASNNEKDIPDEFIVRKRQNPEAPVRPQMPKRPEMNRPEAPVRPEMPKRPEMNRPEAPVRPEMPKRPEMNRPEAPVRPEMPKRPEMNRPEASTRPEMPEEMPKSRNIYEQYMMEDEARDRAFRPQDEMRQEARPQADMRQRQSERPQMPDTFAYGNAYGNMNDSFNDDEDMFSPRDRKVSRADKKAMKAEEKARKKEQKRLKKEYGEFGPVDWQSWQDAVEGGEKTAASASRNANAYMEEEEQEMRRPEPRRRPEPVYEEEQPMRRPEPRRRPEPVYEEEQPMRRPEPKRRPEMVYEDGPRQNPMDMMRNIPANDNKAPVQAKPVQQFDFDDDFEFEFLNLDDED